MAAHGPFEGDRAASSYAPRLAAADLKASSRPARSRCRPTDQPTVPDSAWLSGPGPVARSAHPTSGTTLATVLVLLDRDRAVAATVGPFDEHTTADAWRPDPDVDPAVDRLVIDLKPAPAPDPAT